jgi:predicted AlkP superfamily phosphohydrolase/phosphomutase
MPRATAGFDNAEEGGATPAKVLVIAFDGMEATAIDRMVERGPLPAFAGLRESHAAIRLEGCLDTFPDAIWLELLTGRSAGRHGCYWHPHQVHAGEARQRALRREDIDVRGFLHQAAAAGKRVAAVDIPRATMAVEFDGVEVRDWGTHERDGAAHGTPQELVAGLVAHHGRHPVPHDPRERTRCDDHSWTAEEFARLRDALVRGAAQRTALVLDLLQQDDWDLFTCTFAEAHCAGHQLWHLFDERSPWYEPRADAAVAGALEDVYVAVDRGLDTLLERVDEETTVLVLLSHGMGVNRGGWQLLPEILGRLGHASGQGTAAKVRGRLPEPAKRLLRTVVPRPARTRLQTAGGSLPEPLESRRTRAIAAMNGRCGAVRLNVRGRDPFGAVERGEEYDAACADIAAALLELEDLATGAPAVSEVVRTDAMYGEDAHPSLPDLVVRWNTELPLIESVASRRAGVVSGPVRIPSMPRSGDHSTESRLFVPARCGPAGRSAKAVDFAPTILDLLDVSIPNGLDGSSLLATAPASV